MVSATITTAVQYSLFTPLRESRIAAHGQVVTHSGSAPARYRALVPMLLDGPIKIVSIRWPYEKAFERVYAAFHLSSHEPVLGASGAVAGVLAASLLCNPDRIGLNRFAVCRKTNCKAQLTIKIGAQLVSYIEVR